MNPLLEIIDVVKGYGSGEAEVRALTDVSLAVAPGELVAVRGPSGCGKSTLLHLAGGLEDPSAGRVLVNGRDLSVMSATERAALRRREVGYVFQKLNLVAGLTAIENVMLPLELDGVGRRAARTDAIDALHAVALDQSLDRYPDDFSGGQQQRIAIARSLAMNPDVMLFDEVTAALDPETVKGVLVTIRELAEDGMTCMIVTHEMGFAREVANQVYFTDGGLLVEHGPPKEFFFSARDPRTRQFLDQIL
jgi:polar amino acid transport system ATP-binding protein